MKKGLIVLAGVSLSMLTACSMNTRNIDVSHIDKDTSYFKLGYAQNIVQNIDTIQAARTEKAWNDGVTLSEKLVANAKGVDPYVGWSPKINHPAIEEHTKTKYQDVIELSLLFDGQPAEVVANDELILITMPHDYVWTFSNREVSPVANQYLTKALALVDKKDVRFSVFSQEGFEDSNFGKQWVSQAKADRFRQYLIQDQNIDPSSVQAFGLGSKIAYNSKYFEGDFVQLVIYHKYDVDSSDYVSLGK